MIPFHDWKKSVREGFRTRDGHFMEEFIRHPDVDKLLIINRPISLAEMILLRRDWYDQSAKVLVRRGNVIISQVADRTYTLDILVTQVVRPILLQRSWIPWIFSKKTIRDAVRYSLSYLEMAQKYVAFLSAPLYIPLFEHLQPSVLMLDAQDNLLKHPQYRSVKNLAHYYAQCQSRADLLSANSAETTHWLAQQRPDTLHIANGVDPKVFDQAKAYSIPEDLRSIRGPIVGYAGKMQQMVEVSLMQKAASRLPSLNFVFIGQQLDPKWMKPLWELPNVHYLGDKHYSTVPHYLSSFDICIIPYSVARQHGGDPIKIYEYLAMGKPVVTTDIGGVSMFESYPQVRIAHTVDEFCDSLAEFADRITRGLPIPSKPLPAETFWDVKADGIIQMMASQLEKKCHASAYAGNQPSHLR
jgi:teichuronic acid biosynthesis glycosyltransferase TuaH